MLRMTLVDAEVRGAPGSPASCSNTAASLSATATASAAPPRRHTAPAEQVRSANTDAHQGCCDPCHRGYEPSPRYLLRFHGPGDPPAGRLINDPGRARRVRALRHDKEGHHP